MLLSLACASFALDTSPWNVLFLFCSLGFHLNITLFWKDFWIFPKSELGFFYPSIYYTLGVI